MLFLIYTHSAQILFFTQNMREFMKKIVKNINFRYSSLIYLKFEYLKFKYPQNQIYAPFSIFLLALKILIYNQYFGASRSIKFSKVSIKNTFLATSKHFLKFPVKKNCTQQQFKYLWKCFERKGERVT